MRRPTEIRRSDSCLGVRSKVYKSSHSYFHNHTRAKTKLLVSNQKGAFFVSVILLSKTAKIEKLKTLTAFSPAPPIKKTRNQCTQVRKKIRRIARCNKIMPKGARNPQTKLHPKSNDIAQITYASRLTRQKQRFKERQVA